ncbi:MAG TPA: hypothetical protein VKK79_23010 [Candidatus Lokiarchaeia archaeon]|nr:hypothetical protein [Candidatus Lokiarchaeia archaeon]
MQGKSRRPIAPIVAGILFCSAILALFPLLAPNPRAQPQNPVVVGLPQNVAPQVGQTTFQGAIQLSANPVSRGTNLQININVGPNNSSFSWSFAVQNLTLGEDPEFLGNWTNITTSFNSPLATGNWNIPATASLGQYRVILWVLNGTDVTYSFQSFTVINSPPVINSVFPTAWAVLRGTSFNVNVSATDFEIANLTPSGGSDPNTYVRVYYRDTQGVSSYFNAQSVPGSSTNYTAALTFGATAPLGSYSIWAGVDDGAGFPEVDSPAIQVMIQNNIPTIDLSSGLTINGANGTTGVTVTVGGTLNITVTASDFENTITTVQFDFFNPDTKVWANFTLYYDYTQNIIIPATDIGAGSWYMYVFVLDADGGVGQGAAPVSIQSNPDAFAIAAPIIGFLIGIPAGMGIGIAVLLWRQGRRPKTSEVEEEVEETTAAAEKPRKGGVGRKAPEPKKQQPEEQSMEEEEEGAGLTKRKIRRRIE